MSIQRFQPEKSTSHLPFVIAPTTISEAMEYSNMIASSCFCPQAMKGKPGDILIAIQMGAEIGLSPLQALQNIAVISGKPCVYGDAALAVVISSPDYISHREWFEGSIERGNLIAYCAIKRRNAEEYIKSFSMDDAKKAGLWTKPGVWQQYPTRMLQIRARTFAIRDQFADALRGINIREEVEDYAQPVKAKVFSIKNNKENVQSIVKNVEIVVPAVPGVSEDDLTSQFLDFSAQIEECEDMESLEKVFIGIKKIDWKGLDHLKKLIDLKDAKKTDLRVKEFQQEYGEVEESENFDSQTGEIK